MMRWTVAAGAALACAAALVWGSAGGVAAKSATAASMYAEQVVGTLLETHKMYTSDGSDWQQCELRVDATEWAKSRLTVGQALQAKYQLAKDLSPMQRPGVGDQIRAKLEPPKEAGGIVWTADAWEMLGRGELVNPGEGAAIDLGSPRARVLVKLLAPLKVECHQKTVGLVRELAEREGERARVQVFDMKEPAGRREMQRERIRCATVLINNRFAFTIRGPEGSREVVLRHKPNEQQSSYNSEDVITVAEQEIARLYPDS